MVGTEAGKVLGNLFGWGDYEGTAPVGFDINSNSAMGFQTPTAAQIPMMHTENGCCRIKKREYIKDIFMTSIWSTEVFALNPASAKTFPWLSSVASNFEQYKFLGLAFGFRSLTANALGSVGDPSMGSVTLLTQYDVLDTTVATKIAANNALYATSCKPAENMLHPVECDPEQTPSQPLYTGVNEAPMGVDADRDLRLNYMGFTTVGTNGAPTIYNAGELWVTYDVMLYKPMIDTGQNPPETISVAQTYLAEKEAAARKQAVEECGPPLVRAGWHLPGVKNPHIFRR
jgi:hypothetical protein